MKIRRHAVQLPLPHPIVDIYELPAGCFRKAARPERNRFDAQFRVRLQVNTGSFHGTGESAREDIDLMLAGGYPRKAPSGAGFRAFARLEGKGCEQDVQVGVPLMPDIGARSRG